MTAAVVLLLDQVTKHFVVTNLSDGDVVHVIDDVVTFRLTLNPGGAFGIGQGLTAFFLGASIVVAVMIVVVARRVDDPRWIIPLGLVLGGGLGNLADRIFRDTGGRVVDFVDLQVWPLFNVADAAISIGVVLMFWFGFVRPRHAADE